MNTPLPASTEDVLRALPRPIAIVGNGHSGRELGAAIDRYASVIRLNNFRIAGFEAQVGARTTLRCTSGWSDIEPRAGTIEISPFTAGSAESADLAAYRARSAVPLVTAGADVHTLLPDVAKPSTGLALAVLCASLGVEVDLYGFDGFRSGHYWRPGVPLATTHDRRERELLLALPGVTLYGESYDYASLYDFCHSQHADYNVNEGLGLYRRLGLTISGERILEFGAGNGGLSALLERQGNEVTAVEVSRVAYARIPVARKINGDCLSLATLDGGYDRLVSMDVLEHLTENDIRIVVREAARLAKCVLLSVSTRPSGLLGPNGENLHLTVRSVEWWRELLAPYFQVHMVKGLDLGQLLIEGLRRDLVPAEAPPAPLPPDDYELPRGYRARPQAEYYNDSATMDGGVTWQPDVYPLAADVARSLDCTTLVDIGCGHARKLSRLAPEFRLVGIDHGPNIEHCRRQYPASTWLEADLETVSLLPLPDSVLERSVLICSDVIEHLSDPRALLGALRELLRHAPALVLSTPDRQRTWGDRHAGPPPNPAHTREWTLDELARLLRREGYALAAATHTRSNDAKPDLATILIVAVNLRHPKVEASEVGRAAAASAVAPPARGTRPEPALRVVQAERDQHAA